MTRKALATLFVLLLTLATGVTGCGGGSDGSTAPSDTLTKVEYVKRADEICTKTEGRQEKLVNKYQKQNAKLGGNAAATEKLISYAALPPIAEQIEELSELPPPDKEAAEARAYLKELEKALEVAEKEPGTLLVTPGAFTKSEEVARAFGFKTCRGA